MTFMVPDSILMDLNWQDLQDQHFQSTGSFGGLRYPYSSAYNGRLFCEVLAVFS